MNYPPRPHNDDRNVVRGYLELRHPDGKAGPERRLLFRVNPESLSRQLTIEQGSEASGNAETGARDQNPNGGALKQSFKVMVRLDVDLGEKDRTFRDGIGPELAALEMLVLPYEEWDDGGQAVVLRHKRPLVIFGWGDRRFPVKITGLTINETFHNSALVPIRAEVELTMEVLRADEASDKNTKAILDELASQRRRAAQRLWNPGGIR